MEKKINVLVHLGVNACVYVLQIRLQFCRASLPRHMLVCICKYVCRALLPRHMLAELKAAIYTSRNFPKRPL